MMMARRALKTLSCVMVLASAVGAPALAQDKGSLNPRPLPALAKPDDPKTPARDLFGRKTTAAVMKAQTIGFYSKGCLAGGEALPINGTTWQVSEPSVTVETDLLSTDEYEVRVYDVERGRRLVAAVEIVRLARRIAAAKALARFTPQEVKPGNEKQDDAELLAFAR